MSDQFKPLVSPAYAKVLAEAGITEGYEVMEKLTLTPAPSTDVQTLEQTDMGPLEMIAEWRKGCSCASVSNPEPCQECTRALIDSMEKALLRKRPSDMTASIADAQQLQRDIEEFDVCMTIVLDGPDKDRVAGYMRELMSMREQSARQLHDLQQEWEYAHAESCGQNDCTSVGGVKHCWRPKPASLVGGGLPITFGSHPVDILKHYWPDMPADVESKMHAICDEKVSISGFDAESKQQSPDATK